MPSAVAKVEHALGRIKELDPQLSAFNTVMAERALERARALDAGASRGPLHGVPVAIKDNMCTAGVPTTASSKILAGFIPPYNATVVERLEAAGWRPQDIDFVVCTHLHHDHCGWNTCLRGGKWVPTFPRARYLMQQAEIDRWGKDRGRHKPFAMNEGVFERSVAPVIEAGLSLAVNGKHAFAPGLEVEPAAGHTAGHQMLAVCSAGSRALFTGDVFHHPLQLVEPAIPFGDAEDQAAVEALRRAIVERAARDDALLIAAHLPAPHGIRVTRTGDDFRFAASNRV